MEKKNAISLIVLVITIIVMAILATAVVIALSNTNVVKQAQKTKDETIRISEKDSISSAIAEWSIIQRKETKTFEKFMKEKFGEENVTAVDENKVKITMESGNKYKVTDDGTITDIKKLSASRGAFIEYAVSYTDAYNSNYKYATTNGWRLLDYTDNGNGTYSNVKLISTGVPAILHCDFDDTTSSSWYITDDTTLTNFKNELGSDYEFYKGTDTYYALQAAAGMYYNFKNIKFAYGASTRGRNLGYFTEITSNGTTYNSENAAEITGDKLFIPTGVNATVRLFTLIEINKLLGITDPLDFYDVTEPTGMEGIFLLQNIKNLEEMSSYVYNSGYYWLASPYQNENVNDSMLAADFSGIVGGYSNFNAGVRPIVSFSSEIKLVDENEDGVFEIVQ